MGLLKKRSPLPIGVHIGDEGVHLVQFDQSQGIVRLVAKASKAFGDVDLGSENQKNVEAVDFIKHALSGGNFRGKAVAMSLPNKDLTIQYLRMPVMAPEELAKALPFELEDKLSFSPKGAVIRHIVPGVISQDNETKTEVIVLAVERAVVEGRMRAIARAGVSISTVGAEVCAMSVPFGFLEERLVAQQETPRAVLIFHLGGMESHVAILRGGELVFVKEFMSDVAGVGQGDADAEAGMNNPATQNGEVENLIASEIESCMRYYASVSRGVRVETVYLVGNIKRESSLLKLLAECLGVPVEAGDPLAVISRSSVVMPGEESRETRGEGGGGMDVQPELAVAAGLALSCM